MLLQSSVSALIIFTGTDRLGFAIAAGNSELSIGNIIGSNFVTLTFVTALCAFIRPISIHEQIRERESSDDSCKCYDNGTLP